MHLPSVKPYEIWQHEEKQMKLVFHYQLTKYKPEGLLSHLIVLLHDYIEREDFVWLNGVNITYEEKTFAEIIENNELDTIEIRVAGSNRRGLLDIIRKGFKEITKRFKKLDCQELIPCSCSVCKKTEKPKYYTHKELLEILERGNRDTIICGKSDEDVKIQNLLNIYYENEFHGNRPFNLANSSDWRTMITQGKIQAAIEHLLDLYRTDNEKSNALLQLLGQYNYSEKQCNLNIITSTEAANNRAKISNSLLEMFGKEEVLNK